MASPKFPAQCVWVTLILLSSFCPHLGATTFPLPIPSRPTTFPLSRPTVGGEVLAWGNNNAGQISVPPNLTNIIAVAAAGNYSLALKADGTVVEWGQNLSGKPFPVGLADVSAIAMGDGFAVALKSDGHVVAWGGDWAGDSQVPATLSSIVAVAAGHAHALALRVDGTVIAWGYNDQGQTNVPAGLSDVVAIAASVGASFAIKSDGSVVNWGNDRRSWIPYGLTGVVAIATGFEGGSSRTIALRSDGSLVLASPINFTPLNLKVATLEISAYHAIAIKGDGTVAVWIDGTEDIHGVTRVPPRLRNVISIACGDAHTVAVKLPSPPVPTTARASAQIVNGFVVGLNIIDGGEGYAVPPQVTIKNGGGAGASATAQISKGVVTGFTITNAGIGYASDPIVEIEPPPFLPKLSIATSRVGVTMQVVPGKRYQLEASNDLPNFGPVGAPFVADKDTFTQEFAVSETGQYFRIVELP